MVSIGAIESWLAANQELVLIAVGAAMMFYFIQKKIDRRAFKDYESQTLEERLFPELKYMTRKLGKNTNTPLYHGDHNYLGDAQKVWFSSVSKQDMNRAGFSYDEDEDDEEVEVVAAMIRPGKSENGLNIDYYSWLLSDIMFNKDRNTEIYLFREDTIVENSLDRMKIDESVDFGKYAGILVAQDQRSIAKVKGVAWRMNNEELQNKFPEFAEKVSEARPGHAESISEIKEINEQNKKQDLKRMADK